MVEVDSAQRPSLAISPALTPLAHRTVLLVVPVADRPRTIAVLEAAGALVKVLPDFAALRRAAAMLGPAALVVADLHTDPAQVRASLRGLASQDVVVVLADTSTEAERIALLHGGADHVARRGAPAEVVAMLSTVLRRSPRRASQPDARRAGDICIDMMQRTARVRGRQLRLTPLEFDLMAYFVSNRRTVLSRERLLADVWGYHVGSLETVTVHVRRLRRKLEHDPATPAYLQTIWGVGYKLEPSPRR